MAIRGLTAKTKRHSPCMTECARKAKQWSDVPTPRRETRHPGVKATGPYVPNKACLRASEGRVDLKAIADIRRPSVWPRTIA